MKQGLVGDLVKLGKHRDPYLKGPYVYKAKVLIAYMLYVKTYQNFKHLIYSTLVI